MKTSLIALTLLTGISTTANALETQYSSPDNMRHYVFNYDFNNLQDPTLRQTQHLSQEIEYGLVRDLQQQRQHALSKIGQDVAIYADEQDDELIAHFY